MSAAEKIAPVLKYPGSKFRISSWIIGFFPPHVTYVEPFAGSLAVLLNKAPSTSEYANDLNGEIVNLFKVIRERGDELAVAVEMTPWSREEYQSAFAESDSALERARRTLVRYWQSIGRDARSGAQSGWRHNGVKNPSASVTGQWDKVPHRIIAVARRLKQVQLECLPAEQIVERLDAPDTLFYIDPPYVGGTRRKGLYAQEMEGNAEHEALLEQLRGLKGMVVLSGYAHPIYDTALEGWERVTRVTAGNSGSYGEEVLWINPAATAARTKATARLSDLPSLFEAE